MARPSPKVREMEDLSLHILDIVENGTSAGATLVEISILLDTDGDRMEIRIKDNGRGMDGDMLAGVRDPFVTTRTTRRVGMGVPLLDQATRETGGTFEIHSSSGVGTEVIAVFRPGHIDCKPLGDLSSTMVNLILGNPEVDFLYRSEIDGVKTSLDTQEVKQQLGDVPITEPAVLALIRNLLDVEVGDGEAGTASGRDEQEKAPDEG